MKKIAVVETQEDYSRMIDESCPVLNDGKVLVFEWESTSNAKKIRTAKQNRSMHKDFDNVAKICNDNNITAEMLFSLTQTHFNVTPEAVKEFWHGVLDKMGLEPKTSKLETHEVTQVRQGIEAAFALRFGVDIGDFPSEESMINQSRVREL